MKILKHSLYLAALMALSATVAWAMACLNGDRYYKSTNGTGYLCKGAGGNCAEVSGGTPAGCGVDN